jgi:hypothetical protein
MAAFNVYKKVNEAFTVIVSDDFQELAPPAGYVYANFPISEVITMTAGTPETTPLATATFALGAPHISIPSSEIVTVGPTEVIIPTASSNADIVQGLGYSYAYGGVGIWLGTETTGGSVTGRYKAWIPFIVDLAYQAVIVSATLSFDAITSNGSCGLKIGCDNRPNSITPTTYDELNVLSMTANFTLDADVALWADDEAVSYDITAAVQEVLNIPTWNNNNTIGVLIAGTTLTTGWRYVASYDNISAYAIPTLTITTV